MCEGKKEMRQGGSRETSVCARLRGMGWMAGAEGEGTRVSSAARGNSDADGVYQKR